MFSSLSHLVKHGASDLLKDIHFPDIQWSIEVEFTHCLFLCHIAIDILFHYHRIRYPGRRYQQISKKLSDYMMQLLDKRSFMLQSATIKLRYRDTCFEAVNFFAPHVMKIESKDLCEAAMACFSLEVESRSLLFEEGVERGNKSVFLEGCAVAQRLQDLVCLCRWDPEEVWEMISSVWTEMFYAAYDCVWKEHAYQLGHGGELLTHLALLMAHLGVSKHLRITVIPEEYKKYAHSPPWDWDNLGQVACYLA